MTTSTHLAAALGQPKGKQSPRQLHKVHLSPPPWSQMRGGWNGDATRSSVFATAKAVVWRSPARSSVRGCPRGSSAWLTDQLLQPDQEPSVKNILESCTLTETTLPRLDRWLLLPQLLRPGSRHLYFFYVGEQEPRQGWIQAGSSLSSPLSPSPSLTWVWAPSHL